MVNQNRGRGPRNDDDVSHRHEHDHEHHQAPPPPPRTEVTPLDLLADERSKRELRVNKRLQVFSELTVLMVQGPAAKYEELLEIWKISYAELAEINLPT